MDYKVVKELIEKYDRIIILRHSNPDLDALGSQIGLQEVIKENYPNKEVLITGDMNKFTFLGGMQEINDELFTDALVIICDVSVYYMICDLRYFNCKEILIIDHHNNAVQLSTEDKECTVTYTNVNDNTKVACCETIADMCEQLGFKVPAHAATCLFGGMVTDSGRFQFAKNSSTFRAAAFLLDNGADPNYIYNNLYIETIEARQMKSFFANNMQLTKNNVAYLINDKSVYDKFPGTDPFYISRGMVGQMGGLEGVYIWANFTYDYKNDNVMCEFRSREVIIVDIAKKYGGGGHNQACGATIPNFDLVPAILEDFDKLLEENGYGKK